MELHRRLGNPVSTGEPLFTVHAETPGELAYALDYVAANPDLMQVRRAEPLLTSGRGE